MIPVEDLDRALAAANPGNLGGRGEIFAAGSEGHMLHLGDVEFELLPCERVLVSLPPAYLPFGCALQTTALYPTLAAFLAAMRAR